MINLEIFSKGLIEVIIDQTYRWLIKYEGEAEKDRSILSEIIRTDLISAMYYHMTRWNITNAQARIAINILSLADIETMKDIKTYNYNKLKIAYEHRTKQQRTVSPVQDFYYERDQLHESKWAEIFRDYP